MMHVAQAASKLSHMKPRIGAAVVKGGRVLGIGYNRPGSSKYSQWSRHAEIAAIVAAGDCHGASIYVWRGHAITGEPLMSKPCKGCEEAISLAGIRKIFYSKNT
jgi:deoxycytidylate deaminase